MRRTFRSASTILAATLIAATGSLHSEGTAVAQSTAGSGEHFPSCEDVGSFEAPEAWYSDSPIYVANEMPIGKLRRWARGKPGFQEIWIDRDHLGWITVGFTEKAAARQAELKRKFPEVGAVAVKVPHTRQELSKLQHRVGEALLAEFPSWSTNAATHKGVVEVTVNVLTDDVVSYMADRFGGEPICLDGVFSPDSVPVPGPQLESGDGWRFLGDERDTGPTYRTGIASDAESYATLWAEFGLSEPAPAVDFENEVAIAFAAAFGSSCKNTRLDDVVVDNDRALIYPLIVAPDAPFICTSDARPHPYVVSLDRERLPAGPFVIQLDAADPPEGAPKARTAVDIDLSQPGVIAGPGDVHFDNAGSTPAVLVSGTIIEPRVQTRYRLDVRCGIEWLGRVNDVDWRASGPDGAAGDVPAKWQDEVQVDGSIELNIRLRTRNEPRIEARTNHHSVIYRPTTDTPPECALP
jgi:hypothetical protein